MYNNYLFVELCFIISGMVVYLRQNSAHLSNSPERAFFTSVNRKLTDIKYTRIHTYFINNMHAELIKESLVFT